MKKHKSIHYIGLSSLGLFLNNFVSSLRTIPTASVLATLRFATNDLKYFDNACWWTAIQGAYSYLMCGIK